MNTIRRVLLVATIAVAGLVSLGGAAPASASCIEDPINEGRCLPCPALVKPLDNCIE